MCVSPRSLKVQTHSHVNRVEEDAELTARLARERKSRNRRPAVELRLCVVPDMALPSAAAGGCKRGLGGRSTPTNRPHVGGYMTLRILSLCSGA